MITFRRFYAGPIITAGIIVEHSIIVHRGIIPQSAAGLYLLVLFSGYFGGLRSAIISAAMLVTYNLLFLGDLTAERITVASSYLIAAVLMGWQTRLLRQSIEREYQAEIAATDRVDTNILRLQVTLDKVDTLMANRDLPMGIKKELAVIRVRIAEQLTLQRSYHIMAEEKGFVIGASNR